MSSSHTSDSQHRETLPRTARVRSRRDFDRVFSNRVRLADRHIAVFVGRNGSELARLGIAVGRRFGNAVARNQIKRRIREAFRRLRHELPTGIDYVVLPHPACDADVTMITESIRKLARKAVGKLHKES